MAAFDERKRQIFESVTNGCDNSSIGKIDEHVINLCSLFFDSQNYVTTSSCSGRVSVYWEGPEDKKRSGKWLFVSHDKIDPAALRDQIGPIPQEEGLTMFRFEGFVVHVEARELDSARELLTVALSCGYKNSGLVIGGSTHEKGNYFKRVMVGIRGTLKLEIPIAKDGKWIVDDDYLKFVGELANQKFDENQKRIAKFEEQVGILIKKTPGQNAEQKKRKKTPEEKQQIRLEKERLRDLEKAVSKSEGNDNQNNEGSSEEDQPNFFVSDF